MEVETFEGTAILNGVFACLAASAGSSAKWGVHILHINFMLTHFTYIYIFCAYKCIGETLKGETLSV